MRHRPSGVPPRNDNGQPGALYAGLVGPGGQHYDCHYGLGRHRALMIWIAGREMDEITHSFLHLEPKGTLGRFFCPLDFCSLAGGQMKFKYRDGGPHITKSREGRRGERGTTQEGGASCAQP